MTVQPTTAHWIFIERSAYPHRHWTQDVVVGPYPSDDMAREAMETAVLIDDLLSPSGGGGTDVFLVRDIDPTEYDAHIVDLSDPHHTGRDEQS